MVTVQSSTLFRQQYHTVEMSERVECANHAVKCNHGRLEQLAKDNSDFHGRGDLTKNVIQKITHGACCAIRKNSATNDVAKLK